MKLKLKKSGHHSYYFKVHTKDIRKLPMYFDDNSSDLSGRLEFWYEQSLETGYIYITTSYYKDISRFLYGWMDGNDESISFFSENRYKYKGDINITSMRKEKLESIYNKYL